jgi:hypothetical protein
MWAGEVPSSFLAINYSDDGIVQFVVAGPHTQASETGWPQSATFVSRQTAREIFQLGLKELAV